MYSVHVCALKPWAGHPASTTCTPALGPALAAPPLRGHVLLSKQHFLSAKQLATILAHIVLSHLICEVVSARPTGASSWALSGQGVFSSLACRSHGEQATMLRSGEHTRLSASALQSEEGCEDGESFCLPEVPETESGPGFPASLAFGTLLPIASLLMTSTGPPPPGSLPELTATSAPAPVHSHAGFLQGDSDPHSPQRKPLEPMLQWNPAPEVLPGALRI